MYLVNQEYISNSIFELLPSPFTVPNIFLCTFATEKTFNRFIMAGTVTYILKDPKATRETPVNLMFWYDQFRFKIATGEKIGPKYWNSKTRRSDESERYPQHKVLNTTLDNLEEAVLVVARTYFTKNISVDPKKLRDELVKVVRPQPASETISFFEAVNECIDSTNIADSTKLSYTNTLKTLQEYDSQLTFASINLAFYQDFVTHLTEVKNLGINTIGTRIKNLKTFMNYALEKGYTANLEHQHKKFKKVQETTETIYLNKKELSAIYKLDLTGNPRMNKARDFFLIGKHTGLRFADLSPVMPTHTSKKDPWLKIARINVNEIIVIPFHWTIKELFTKGTGESPLVFTIQKMNDYVEDLAVEINTNERVKITKRLVALSLDQASRKWVLITKPTPIVEMEANLLLTEVPAVSIMKMNGCWRDGYSSLLFSEIS